MKWVDDVWGTATEQELKQLYMAMKDLKKEKIYQRIKIAIETKKFWRDEKTKLQIKREEKNITIEELASMTGIPPTQINRYESGLNNINHAKFCTVFVLAKALSCDVWDIIETTPMPIAPEYKIKKTVAV